MNSIEHFMLSLYLSILVFAVGGAIFIFYEMFTLNPYRTMKHTLLMVAVFLAFWFLTG